MKRFPALALEHRIQALQVPVDDGREVWSLALLFSAPVVKLVVFARRTEAGLWNFYRYAMRVPTEWATPGHVELNGFLGDAREDEEGSLRARFWPVLVEARKILEVQDAAHRLGAP